MYTALYKIMEKLRISLIKIVLYYMPTVDKILANGMTLYCFKYIIKTF